MRSLIAFTAWLLFASTGFGALATSRIVASFTDTDGTSFTTASVSPTANALVLLYVLAHDSSSAPESPTGITGTNWANGLTWNLESSITVSHTLSGGSAKLHVYSAVAPGSVSAGTITATFTATHEKYLWHLVQWTDTVTPTVVQVKAATATGDTTATFDATPQATNGSAAFGSTAQNAALTFASNLTNYGSATLADSAPPWISQSGYALSSPPSAALGDANAQPTGVIYIEVGQPASGSAVPVITFNDRLHR